MIAMILGLASLVCAWVSGYAIGRWHERRRVLRAIEAQVALAERIESTRTPGQPTNVDAPPAIIKVARVRRAHWNR
jgi:hypothetical protein